MPRLQKKARVAYLIIAGSELIAFVSTEFNWIRTHWCVLVVGCPQCKAMKGRPCLGDDGPTSMTHYVRRHAAKGKKPTQALMSVAIPNPLPNGVMKSMTGLKDEVSSDDETKETE